MLLKGELNQNYVKGGISLEVTNHDLTCDNADWVINDFPTYWNGGTNLKGKSWILNLVDCPLLSARELLCIKCKF